MLLWLIWVVACIKIRFRTAFESLANSFSVDVRGFERVNSNLHGHHGHEDAHWFPKLRRVHPELRGEINLLEENHNELVALEPRITRGDLSALKEFVALLLDHLNREELLTVPFLLDGTGSFH